jgi:GNAT superfamily N-acetyltransferase
VRDVTGRIDRYRFVDLPFRIFGKDPSWVPPLRMAVHDRLSPRNPAAEHQEWATWMAWRRGRVVGRIGACVDRLFDEFQSQRWVWVGFFESFDDPDAANALFEQAWSWGRERGATVATGPASFTTNDECGLQVDGFDRLPLVLTTQNPPYYERLWTSAGWEPAIDLWAWEADRAGLALSDRQRQSLDRLRRRNDLHVRELRMADFDAEVGRFFEVYNAAWAQNWGFAPMTEGEVRHLAKNLKQLIDPTLGIFAEDADGRPVGVALALPDTNEALRHIRSGRLLPFGWARLLWGIKHARRVRVLALGVRPEVRSRALGPLLYQALADNALANRRLELGEASWVLSTNTAMNHAMAALGGQRSKTWRMYQRAL